MFDHVSVEVRDLNRSEKVYDAVLTVLGYRFKKDLRQYGAIGFGPERPQFWIGEGKPGATEDEMHICFAAKTRADVRAFHEAALKAGGRDHGKPGIRPDYHAHYYGAFVLDPDGHNIEACCHQPE